MTANVQIGEVVTDMVIQESVGSLAPEEVKRLVAIVLEHAQRQQEAAAQREKDTKITNSAFHERD